MSIAELIGQLRAKTDELTLERTEWHRRYKECVAALDEERRAHAKNQHELSRLHEERDMALSTREERVWDLVFSGSVNIVGWHHAKSSADKAVHSWREAVKK